MKKSKRGKRILSTVCFLTAAVIAAAAFFEYRAIPIITGVAVSQAENVVNNVIESSIVRVIEENKITYSSLVCIEKDNAGRVSTVKADTINMNVLKSKISREISNEILEIDNKEIKIPIGTIIGTSFLSGKGPKIKTEVTLSSNFNTAVSNKFTSAGINQTAHEIIVTVSATVYVIMPRSIATAQVSTDFCIAQTVIIGTVPEAFAEFEKSGVTA